MHYHCLCPMKTIKVWWKAKKSAMVSYDLVQKYASRKVFLFILTIEFSCNYLHCHFEPMLTLKKINAAQRCKWRHPGFTFSLFWKKWRAFEFPGQCEAPKTNLHTLYTSESGARSGGPKYSEFRLGLPSMGDERVKSVLRLNMGWIPQPPR